MTFFCCFDDVSAPSVVPIRRLEYNNNESLWWYCTQCLSFCGILISPRMEIVITTTSSTT